MRPNMRRRLNRMIALVALSAGLVACGDSTPYWWGWGVPAYTTENQLVIFSGRQVQVFDRDGRNLIRSMPIPPPPTVVSGATAVVSADGTTVAFATEKKEGPYHLRFVEVRSMATRQDIASFSIFDDPNGDFLFPPVIVSGSGMALSPTGDVLAVVTAAFSNSDFPSRLRIWRIADQTLLADLVSPGGRQNLGGWNQALAFSPDGAALYALELQPFSGDSPTQHAQYLRAFNVADGSQIWQTSVPVVVAELPATPTEGQGPRGPVFLQFLAVSPDGGTLGSVDTNLGFWRASDGTPLGKFPVAQAGQSIGSMAFSPDGARILTTLAGEQNGDYFVEIFSRDGSLLSKWPFKSYRSSAVFSPDGQRIATDGEKILIWDANTGTVVQRRDP